MQNSKSIRKSNNWLASNRVFATEHRVVTVGGLLIIFIVFVYGKFTLFAFGDIEAVVSNVPDDAAYYYKIARNVVLGQGLTFDGLNQTNGFQPLWLYMLLPLAWAMRQTPVELYLRAALIFQLALVAAAGVLFFIAMSLYARRSIAFASTTLFYLVGIVLATGMESGMLMLCLSGLLYVSLRYRLFSDECTLKRAFGFGLLLGLTVLARLDMIFLPLILYVLLLWKMMLNPASSKRIHLIKQSLTSALAFGLITTPYFAFNKIHFGSIMPISGEIKNSFPHILQASFATEKFPLQALLTFILTCVLSTINIFLFRHSQAASNPWERYKFSILLIGTVYVLTHYMNTALFMKWGIFMWHFASYFFHFCLVFADTAERLISCYPAFGLRRVMTIVILALIGALMFRSYRHATFQPGGWQVQSYRAALWTRNNLPKDARLALSDAGFFGLFSERIVVNLDGLVNNREYQEYLRGKQLGRYLRQKGVQYLVMAPYRPGRPQYTEFVSGSYTRMDIPFRSHLYNTLSDPIRVYREDEVYRSPVYYDGPYRTVFVIWRLR